MHRFLAPLLTVASALASLAGDATWIGPATSGVNRWTRYRTTFDATDPPSTAPLRIAVDSKYWLWLNGIPVVREGGLKRGPDPGSTYSDIIELGPHLKSGENTLAVLVWHFGQHGFSHNSSGTAGLFADSRAIGLASGSTWKISDHPAISTSPDIPPNRRLPESSLLFDARLDQPDWTAPGFDDSGWAAPRVHGAPPAAPWGPLVDRPIPLWKDFGLKEYPSVTGGPGGTITAKLPHNAQVTPWLRVEAPAGLVIDIRTDNFMGGSEPNVHAKYITRAGVQEFECPGWMNGHEVRYQVPEGVGILGLKYRETGYDTGFTGSFRCDDADLDVLWQKAARTLYVTMRDTYMDCPDRERSQWWGDVVNELGEVPYALDPRAHLLTRKAIRELVDWQRHDGILYSPVPAGLPAGDTGGRSWYSELPVQMLASVGKYGFWNYYLHSGDAATVRHAYPAVARYLDLWKLGPDGLAIHRPGDWDWSDWGENIDVAVLDSAWLQLALEGAIEMARLSGNHDDIPRWRSTRATLSKRFNRTFWTGSEYRSPGYTGDTDDRANALAVLAGFAAPEQYPALRDVLGKHRNASPWMEKYVLEALYLMDAPDLAVSRMKERYRAQIDSPLTTLWEGWGIGSQGYGGGSYNHAWSGGPLTCLSQFAAGIAPVEPGWKSFSVLPRMGPLRDIDAKVDTPRGLLHVALSRTDSSFSARISPPPDTSGLLGIPRQGKQQLRFVIDGRPARPERTTSGHYLFRLPSAPCRVDASW